MLSTVPNTGVMNCHTTTRETGLSRSSTLHSP